MKKTLKAVVPPTKEQGSCSLLGFCSLYETYKQNILWAYNKMREHDGLQPVVRMPKGTKYRYTTYIGAIG
jgi:hypothetical protein